MLLSAPPTGAVAEALDGGDEYVSVFLPCTPNPTTGFFFYLPARDVIELDITPDEAAKLIMSAGVIQPELRARLAQPATRAPEIPRAAE